MSSTSATGSGCVLGRADATTFPLLGLPGELHERIYIAVLRWSASPVLSRIRDRVSGETLWPQNHGKPGDHCNIYPLFPLLITTSTSTLLILNRQVHAQIKEIISRNEITRSLTYKLYCMMVDERQLYPSWLSIPSLSSNVDVVEASFRLFGDVKGRHSGWSPGNGGPGSMHWGLLELLKRFLKRGLDFLPPPKSSGVKIRELVVNVVTPEEPSEGFIPHYVGISGWREGLIHPEAVVQEIKRGLRLLWPMPFAKRVPICLDGQEMHTWDVKGIKNIWSQSPNL